MRKECAEIVKRGYEALNRGALGEVIDLIHPDFQFDAATGTFGAVKPFGPRQFERLLRNLTADWDEFHCELEEVRHAGELLVALVLEQGRERSTGELVRRHSFHIWTLRDNKAVRFGRHPRVTAATASA
jgi:ketosteroid isomerase-like protein